MRTQPISTHLITLSGIDGSGKSTLAHQIQAFLWETHTLPSHHVWCKYGVHPLTRYRLSRFAQRPKGKNQRDGKGEMKDPTLAASLYRKVLLVFHLMQIKSAVCNPLRHGDAVICDRYIFDTMVDLQQEIGWSLSKAQRALGASWIPQPRFKFLLDLPEALAFARKTDTASISFLKERRSLYLQLSDVYGLTLLDATQPQDALLQHIIDTISPALTEEAIPYDT